MVYLVKCHDGETRSLTPRELCERVKKDAERSTRNWLASPAELIRVTGRPYFSDDCAIGVRVAILECFAVVETCHANGGDYLEPREADAAAIEECYNSLYGIDDREAIDARGKYLRAMIDVATMAENCFDFIAHPGDSFKSFRQEWINGKYAEYRSRESIDFKELNATLRPEWLDLKHAAEDRGDFDEDDRKIREKIGEAFVFRRNRP